MNHDFIVSTYPIVSSDEDLSYCKEMAYQKDISELIDYEKNYFNHYVKLLGTEKAQRINDARILAVDRTTGDKFSPVCDVGIGSGEFISSRNASRGPITKGYDINPNGEEWLKRNRLWADKNFECYRAFTFWDTLEHVPEPDFYFKKIPKDSFVLVSIPIFDDLSKVKRSKHYKPGEHIYYFTEKGFIDWMAQYGFEILEKNAYEILAGREGIGSYAFQKTGRSYDELTDMWERKYWVTNKRIANTRIDWTNIYRICREKKFDSIFVGTLANIGIQIPSPVKLFRHDEVADKKEYDGLLFDITVICYWFEFIYQRYLPGIIRKLRRMGPNALIFIDKTSENRKTVLNNEQWCKVLKRYYDSAEVEFEKADYVCIFCKEIQKAKKQDVR